MKVKYKYYVASRTCVENTNGENWAKETLDEAIEHAEELCEQTKKTQYIAMIIEVVKPQRTPAKIEDVE